MILENPASSTIEDDIYSLTEEMLIAILCKSACGDEAVVLEVLFLFLFCLIQII